MKSHKNTQSENLRRANAFPIRSEIFTFLALLLLVLVVEVAVLLSALLARGTLSGSNEADFPSRCTLARATMVVVN